MIALISLSFVLTTINSIQAATPAEHLLRASGIKGGVVVHLGCGDGRTTATLHASDRFLVCGLDTDADKVEEAKAHIDSLGLYGKVSAEKYDGKNLPYGDNIVNLLVTSGECQVASEEITRVLVPGGVALTLDPETRNLKPETFFRKPWPADIDQWTHFLYDSTGNAVCKDKGVRRLRHVQWYAGPKRSRHHEGAVTPFDEIMRLLHSIGCLLVF